MLFETKKRIAITYTGHRVNLMRVGSNPLPSTWGMATVSD